MIQVYVLYMFRYILTKKTYFLKKSCKSYDWCAKVYSYGEAYFSWPYYVEI
jgi:hypothetical protein